MFFELREYRMLPGKQQEWIDHTEKVIIPFQMSKGMVIVGCFVSLEEDDLYIWIRRFEDEAERERLYKAVYENDTWQNDIRPKNSTLMDRSRRVVRRIEATSRSVIQ